MPLPILPIVIGLGAVAAYLITRKPDATAVHPPYATGLPPKPLNLPSPYGGPGDTPPAATPQTLVSDGKGGLISISNVLPMPVSMNTEMYQVNTQTDPLLLRSDPAINGHAVGQGNVVAAVPKGGFVVRVPGTQDQGNSPDVPGGFRNVRTLSNQNGWMAVEFLVRVSPQDAAA